VIPLFDIITRKLDGFVDDESLRPCVRHAAARGRAILTKYYGLSDDSIMYRIAIHMLILFIPFCHDINYHFCSSSSEIQVGIFCQGWLASRVDQNSGGASQGPLERPLQAQVSGKSSNSIGEREIAYVNELTVLI
jgi:hypothetical protein